MKKFYAFAAAALCAFAANAQDGAPLYATGNATSGLSFWSADEPTEFTFADGKYTLEVEGLVALKISTAKGTWDEFNAGCYGCAYGKEAGATVALQTPWEANIDAPVEGGDYTIEVAGDLSTIKMTMTGGDIDPNANNIYLRGDMNGWCNDWIVDNKVVDAESASAWMFKPMNEEETIYALVFGEGQAIGVGEAFKISNPSWSKNWGGATNIMAETPTPVSAGGDNMTTEEEITGCIWLTTDYEGEAYVEVSNDKTYVPEWAEGAGSGVASIAADSNVAPKYFNLQGVQVANPENGLFIVVKGNKTSKVLVK
ncbi:MAG: hypothetical protein K2H96_05965 [Muribaculaceae bacterium]|nr:hypothetical protein [Muribaculaceae bacterium]